MLSKLATRNFLGRNRLANCLQQRLFSTALLVESSGRPNQNYENYISLWEISQGIQRTQAAKVAKEAGYLADLKLQNVDRSAFKPVTVNENDHGALKKIKAQINAIVE